MLIQNKKMGSKGLFFIENDGHLVAELVYSMPSPDKMIIEHTEVSDELKGQQVAQQLVFTAVEYARTHAIKIVPLCSFTNAVFRRTPEYADVLYH